MLIENLLLTDYSLFSGVTSGGSSLSASIARDTCLNYLVAQVSKLTCQEYSLTSLGLQVSSSATSEPLQPVKLTGTLFGIPPFYIPKG